MLHHGCLPQAAYVGHRKAAEAHGAAGIEGLHGPDQAQAGHLHQVLMGQRRPWGEAGHHGPGQGQVRLYQGIAAAHQGIAGPKSSGWSRSHRCTSGLWGWRGGCQGGGSSSNGRRSCSGNEGGSHRDGDLELGRTAGNGGNEGGHGRHQHRCFHDARSPAGALSPDRRNNVHPIGGWRAPGGRWAFQPAGRVEGIRPAPGRCA